MPSAKPFAGVKLARKMALARLLRQMLSSGSEVTLDGQEYLIMKESDIFGIINGDGTPQRTA